MNKRTGSLPFLLAALAGAALLLCSCGGSLPGGGEAGGGGAGAAANDYSFLVCGDPHGRTDLLEEVVAQAREGEFLVVVGDVSTGKGLAEMQGMKDFLDATGITYHVIPGDNDMPGGDASVFTQVFGPDHYALDFQGTRLVFLNDAVQGVGCPQEQLAWLRQNLAEMGEERVVIGFAHVPPGAPLDVGHGGFQPRETESAREMLRILESAGASVLYCGHIHAYMLYSSGPPRVVVTGGAGAAPHLSEQAGGFHHFLRVTVRGDEVSEEAIRL